MFLTPDELEELTDCKLRSTQIRWLNQHGWHFEISRAGKPKVLKAYAEQKMGLSTAVPKSVEPDWGKI